MYRYLSFILFLYSSVLFAQQSFPLNGPSNPQVQAYALAHAKVWTDAEHFIDDALLLINEGKLVYVGAYKNIPANYSVIDYSGKFIYPSFIDLYSDYGIKWEPKNALRNTHGYTTTKRGAYHWNEAIRSEEKAALYFSPDEKQQVAYLNAGFGMTLSAIQDGICRGSSALVSTVSSKAQSALIKDEVSMNWSFNKGSSSVDYPNSAMGAVALIRQSLYDAKWIQHQNTESNISLLALNQHLNLPVVFDAENKWAVLRAAKIANEFAFKNWVIKGNGDEYQRIQELAAMKLPMILPLNFPKPYDVEDAFDANLVNLADLMHWENAPTNLASVSAAKIPFSITMKGCEDAEVFLKNLRLAVQNGLSEKAALQSLTEIPANLMGVSAICGSIKKGMPAYLVVCNNSIFKADAKVLEHWKGSDRLVLGPANSTPITGLFKLTSSLPYQFVELTNTNNKYKANLIGKDTINLTVTERAGTYQFTWQSKSQPISYHSMQLVFGGTANQIQANGMLYLADGNTSSIQLKLEIQGITAATENKDSIQKITPVIRYPFAEFGRTKLPIQEEIIFKNASVWTNTSNGILQQTDVHIKAGKIIAIGNNLQCASARIVPAENMHLTNGIIDEHSHLAIYNGVNECSQAITAEVSIGDVIQPEDINIYRQLAGGVIGAQLLHGSCNPIGGQSALIKLRWGKSAEEMKIKGADGFIKFALGENVKQSSGGPGLRYPQTRMGVEQIYIDAFNRALVYEQELKKNPSLRRDLELETLLEILRKKRFISCHSYVQSEINMLMHIANDFGFKVNTFTHILEGYKVADKMKAHGVAASTFADWWAYKFEVMDAIPYNGAILNDMGIVTAINSDDAEMGRRLNQEAAKMIKYGNLTEEAAWKMLTLNPAKILHLEHLTGTIEVGKDADLVLWNNNPLSIYAKPLYTFVDGACYFSLEEDLKMRQENQKERNRLIQKMIALKKQGFKTQKQISKQDENYHCEDEN